jgi:hypothetical protein
VGRPWSSPPGQALLALSKPPLEFPGTPSCRACVDLALGSSSTRASLLSTWPRLDGGFSVIVVVIVVVVFVDCCGLSTDLPGV